MQQKRATVIPFSNRSRPRSTPKFQQTTPGKATSSKPLPPLLALSEGRETDRLHRYLQRLDAEQIQIMEIVACAILRGAR